MSGGTLLRGMLRGTLREMLRGIPIMLISAIGAAVAADVGFNLPVDCSPGEDCWVVNHVALSGTRPVDYTCGRLTYRDHKGTDISLRDLAAMRRGVDVLAPASGQVLRTRDGEPDGVSAALRKRARERGLECGNGLVIRHDSGLETQYCHLKRGSLRVEPGDRVVAGTVLGQVGASGFTEFPHLHFQVSRDGEILDPFTGQPASGACGKTTEKSFWTKEAGERLSYRRGQIFNAGFSDAPPELDRVRAGRYRRPIMRCDANALVAWVEVYGVASGDLLTLEMLNPDGVRFFQKEEVLEKAQARIFRFNGRRLKTDCWPVGRHIARYRLFADVNKTELLSEREFEVEVLPAVRDVKSNGADG